MPKKSEQYQCGHAICIIGYDDSKKLYKFKNSWNKEWAVKGFRYLTYSYLRRYCVDAWSVTGLIENPKALVKKIDGGLNAK